MSSNNTSILSLNVISWNVLNDQLAHKNRTQKARLKELVDTLQKRTDNLEGPTVIFLCEVSKSEYFSDIAKALNYKLVDEPTKYSKNEYMGFLVHDIEQANVVEIPIEHLASKEQFIKLETEVVDIFGVHYPPQIIRESSQRLSLSKQILYSLQPRKQSIITGDFNCLSNSRPRKLLHDAQLYETHTHIRPTFPSGHFRGKNLPKLTPPLQLDTMYYTKKLTLNSVTALNTTASDHPLIHAGFSL